MKEEKQDVRFEDIAVLLQAVDVAAQRGAFRANEMFSVGSAVKNLSQACASQLKEKNV